MDEESVAPAVRKVELVRPLPVPVRIESPNPVPVTLPPTPLEVRVVASNAASADWISMDVHIRTAAVGNSNDGGNANGLPVFSPAGPIALRRSSVVALEPIRGTTVGDPRWAADFTLLRLAAAEPPQAQAWHVKASLESTMALLS